ncbi:hypothetical protein K402DRAFT_236247 [Aulographum hederae CBS 113979]|uniref:Uncharacterized protein n=1 Tax=Aulographum hederae CBS 113979 TaxID=1176131 RepID=A0A6G1GKX7_9PEZI|nr:hypothetical protein K402DRAFT_236247 [Aulographum hederae CBS 113979]
MTLFEKVQGFKPDISHLRILGCRAYTLNKPTKELHKLEPRALIGYLVNHVTNNLFRV